MNYCWSVFTPTQQECPEKEPPHHMEKTQVQEVQTEVEEQGLSVVEDAPSMLENTVSGTVLLECDHDESGGWKKFPMGPAKYLASCRFASVFEFI